MARIAFILLCHKDPMGIVAQARRLTASGDFVAIHFDGRSSAKDYELLKQHLGDDPAVTFTQRRLKCGWGEWSLVAATLEAVRAAVTAFPEATHFYMLSGDCMPIKSASYAHDFLDNTDVDYIENFDFFESDWIKTGFKEERLIYRFWFNERTQKRLFYTSYEIQRRLGLTRKVPAGLKIKIGSQWWCLRRGTVEKVLQFCDSRPDVMRFFATTWIPDETFFQTIVPHVVARKEIQSRTLTFLMFTDYGMPVTFYNDHYDLLLGQNYLFARKISPEAAQLKQRLGELWQDETAVFPISNEGPGLFRFLTARGRIGRRFAPRFWETDGSLDRGHSLLILVAKKWHIAKRLTDRIRRLTSIAAVDYLFNEKAAMLPDLGGVESSVEKRHRHRKALIRLLFDQYETDKLVICLDPSALDMISDLASDKASARVMLIESEFDDDYLLGHIGRVGLASDKTPREVLGRLLPTVRQDLEHEAERLRDLGLESFYTLAPSRPKEGNAVALSAFLGIDKETADEILNIDYLFSD